MFHSEFLLRAGATRDFEVKGKGKQIYVGFSAQGGFKIQKSYGAEKEPSPIQLLSRTLEEEFIHTVFGGGMKWKTKGDKGRFTMKNLSTVDTRIVIMTKKKEAGKAK